MVALDTALAHPHLVDGLILDATVPLTGWDWAEELPVAPALKLARTKDLDTIKRAFVNLPLFEAARELPEVLRAIETMAAEYAGWHFNHRDPAEWAADRAVDHLGEISIPTLVVVGGRDVLDVRLIAERLANEIPNSSKVMLPAAGHLPEMEDPRAFNAAVLDFPRQPLTTAHGTEVAGTGASGFDTMPEVRHSAQISPATHLRRRRASLEYP